MSRSNLHRKLHKQLGISTSQFIREYRLKRALQVLKQEEITASEVAYRVGFSSATYFSTCFHKFYGYTPGDIKSRNPDELVDNNEQSIHEAWKGISTDSEKSKTEKSSFKKNPALFAILRGRNMRRNIFL